MKLSVAIITFNEQDNIRRCLESILTVADEIIVVDSYSTDNTEAICSEYDLTFVKNTFAGHIEQKNYATGLATHEYILSLDADEALSDQLQQAIIKIKKNENPSDAYIFHRITSYCGRWIKHCGWYPDKKVRLWRKNKGKWGGENPHDKVILNQNSTVTTIPFDILHYSFSSIASHVQTANNFSTIAAKAAFEKGKKANVLWHMILNPAHTFIKKYFFKLGFLDGFYGFVICYLSSVSNFLKYSKLRQLNKHNEENSVK